MGASDSWCALVGYEWSASPGTQNLHRNVIFAGEQVPTLPFSYFDGSRETDLWSDLAELAQAVRALACAGDGLAHG